MDSQYKDFEKNKEELERKTHNSGLFEGVLGTENIPVESLAAMGSNVSLAEFLDEMKAHGLEVHLKPKAPKAEEPREMSDEELEAIPLKPEVEDTLDNRRHYEEILEEAQEKLHDVSVIQSALEEGETDPDAPLDEAVLEEMNTAGYLGEFDELRSLSKKLKK